MKTDDLVALLSTNPELVDRSSVVRTLCVALTAGMVVGLDDDPRLGFSHREARFRSRDRQPRVGLPDKAGTPRWGAKNPVFPRRYAVSGHCVSCGHQPLVRAQLTLGRDDRGRSVAGMPALDSDYRDSSFRYLYLGRAKSCAYQSCSYRCCCRSHCRRRKRDGLCAALHRRFIAVRRCLVRRHNSAMHLSRCSIGTAAIALVKARVQPASRQRERVTGRRFAPNS